MECREVQERLSAWLDQETAEPEAAALAAHLESCPVCRREAEAWRRLDQVLADLEAPTPSGLAPQVLSRLPRRRSRWQRSLSLAASLVLGITLGGALAGNFFAPLNGEGNGGEVLAFEAFQDFPQGSLGHLLTYPADEDSQA